MTDQDEIEISHYEIPETNLDVFEKKFAKLQKLAAKCECAPPTYKTVGESFRAWGGKDGWLNHKSFTPQALVADRESKGKYARLVRFVHVEVSGDRPKLADWRFLAKLEHTSEGTMVHKFDAETIVPEKYRSVQIPACDHCGLDRKRRDTYIAVNDATGETIQVGRSCLRDFSGHKTPEQIAQFCSYFESFSGLSDSFDPDSEDSGEGRVTHFSLETVLSFSASIIETNGYLSAAKASEACRTPTSAFVLTALCSKNDNDKPTINDSHRGLAAKVTTWAAELTAIESEDYLWNLSILARLEIVPFKRVGLAVSMIQAYKRATEERVTREAKTFKPSEWFGAEKDKVQLTLRVLNVFENENRYGVTFSYIMATEAGDVVKWNASNPMIWDSEHVVEQGDVIDLKGTINGHTNYVNYRKQTETKQTLITRCKLLKVVSRKADSLPAAA